MVYRKLLLPPLAGEVSAQPTKGVYDFGQAFGALGSKQKTGPEGPVNRRRTERVKSERRTSRLGARGGV